ARSPRARRAARRDLARALLLRRRSQPGQLHDLRGRREGDLHDNPCGSGQRLVRNGAYEGLPDGGGTREAHDWSFGRKGFPLYCTHCSFMNESMPIQWSGYPLYPSEPPEDYSSDPCTWYWYKDPDDIPERHWQRYGATKPGRQAS